MRILLLLLVSFLTVSVDSNVLDSDEIAVSPDEYLVTIFEDRRPKCLGAFVGATSTSSIVVTAARCVYSSSSQRISVQFGASTDYDRTREKLVMRMYVHPYYNPPSLNYDIAILKTEPGEAMSRDLKSLQLNKVKPLPGTSVTTIACDLKGTNKTIASANGAVDKIDDCKTKYGGLVPVTQKMLCVNIENTISKNVPDGSPLVLSETLSGIATKNFNSTLPRIYVNVANSEIYSFIEKFI